MPGDAGPSGPLPGVSLGAITTSDQQPWQKKEPALRKENWIWKQQTWVCSELHFSSFVWASVSSLANGHGLCISWIAGGAMHGAQVRFPKAEEIRGCGWGPGVSTAAQMGSVASKWGWAQASGLPKGSGYGVRCL